MLILAILAAIAIPALRNQQNRGLDTSAKSAVRNAQTAMETWYTDYQSYEATAADLREVEPALAQPPANTLLVTGGSDSYTLRVTAVTGNQWFINKTAAEVTRTCVKVSKHGSCPASGSW